MFKAKNKDRNKKDFSKTGRVNLKNNENYKTVKLDGIKKGFSGEKMHTQI